MRSSGSSTTPSGVGERVRRVAVITHGRAGQIGEGLSCLERVAGEEHVELVFDPEEAAKHGRAASASGEVGLAVVLGGDGTMLRALQRYLGSDVPVLGANFGRVGFLSSIARDGLEDGLRRALRGDYEVVDLSTVEVRVGDGRFVGVNDVVVTSAELGRMVELGWAVGGEDLGRVPCDGLVCSTPSGSTAYNLSNGGPVLVWGLDAMALTFVAPHSLHARPLVVPRGRDVVIRNATAGISCAVLVDGHRVGDATPGAEVAIALGERRARLAMLSGVTFLSRYRNSFAS
ncbi:MAG: NAD(+)/NADH kinase [Actinobacteria bacterium]|nr:NAD(+)/NADH kinase [Actinomycetota bacterium]